MLNGFSKFSAAFLSNVNIVQVIVSVVAFSQGVQHLADLSVQFMFKDQYHVSPVQLSLIMTLISLPWLLKPIWGIITDSYPIFGSRRKYYLVICGFGCGTSWLCLSQIGFTNIYLAIFCLFMVSLNVCVCNVVGEALMVQQASKNQNQKSKLSTQTDQASKNVSLFFGIKAVGGLISSYFSGYLLMYLTKSHIFMINSLFPFTMGFLSLLLDERTLEQSKDTSLGFKKCFQLFAIFIRNPQIYKPISLILCYMMAPSSGPIMFYFYTNVLGFTPIFLGQLKFMYSIGAILGVLLYNNFLKNIAFNKIFLTTTIIYFCFYQSLILLVTRSNVGLGIPDKFFCLGDSIMLQLVGELNIMPILVLACKICPKQIEATMYAFLMATISIGQLIGSQFGNLLLYNLSINSNNFDNLWIFILISSIFFLFPLPWTKYLDEPQEKQKLTIQNNDDEIETLL